MPQTVNDYGKVFEGKTVLVTGASRGIGFAIAEAFAKEGSNLFLVARDLNKLVLAGGSLLTQYNVKVAYYPANVANSIEVQTVYDRFRENYESLDVLVNNAGITRDNLSMRMSDEQWSEVLGTNLTGPFNFCREAYGLMNKKGGSIINIGSIIGLTGNRGQANYAASKAGLIGLTKNLERELGGRDIRVNLVSPGYVETDLTSNLTDEQKKAISEGSSLKRIVTVNDIANAVLFLASDASGSITGQNLVVDAGLV